MKKTMALQMACVLAFASMSGTAGAKGSSRKPRVVRGTYTVSATPVPMPWLLPNDQCNGTEEGVAKVARPFKAPFTGWLTVDMTFSSGGWDLFAVDAEGTTVALSTWEGWYSEPKELITHHMRRGEEIQIVTCNWSSTSDAKVKYLLREGAARSVPAGRGETRAEELAYISPSAGMNDHSIVCFVGLELGCTGIVPSATDRSVSVKIEDTAFPAVAARLFQFRGTTLLPSFDFCTSTEEPLPVFPGADWLGVEIFNGPCHDGTPAGGTQGKVTLTFSNR